MENSMEKEKIKILIVDDVEVNLIILEEIIKNMGYCAVTALSVADAIELLKDTEDLPRVILSDISMPDIDGFSFCTMLKKNPYTRDIPVIFISAMDQAADRSQGFELGAVDYINKPFDRTEVELRINTHLKIYMLQKELEENNRRLSRIVTRHMEKMHKEQKNIMIALARLVELKEEMASDEKQNNTHYSNVPYNSKILTQGMQFSPRFEELSPEEKEIVYTHTTLGAKVLSDIYENVEHNDFIDMAIDIAHYHHENWDGTGYPCGLKGTEIPLSARIVKVVDVYDAMVNERPYKNGIPIDETLKWIEDGAGKYFDPDIIQVFMKIHRNFIEGPDPYQ